MTKAMCPRCQTVLYVSPEHESGQVTCVRCLNVFSLEHDEVSEGHCSRCGNGVEPSWKFCPNCNQMLPSEVKLQDVPSSGPPQAHPVSSAGKVIPVAELVTAGEQTGRDLSRVGLGLVVLGALITVGLLSSFFFGSLKWSLEAIPYTIGTAVLLIGIGTVLAAASGNRRNTTAAVTAGVTSMVALVGVVALLPLVIFMSLIAALFSICSGGG